jgi:hypothetical protein
MKFKTLFLLLPILITYSSFAQECSTFFPFKEGAYMEYTAFSKKGKVESITENRVQVIEEKDNQIRAELSTVLKDKKGKESYSGTFEVFCEDGKLLMDINSMFNPAMQQSFSGYEVTIEGDALSFPADIEVGQELPDASSKITTAAGGINIASMTMDITDRKVEDKTTISTDAGTYECFKIRQTSSIKMMISRSYSTVEYFAEGIGVVRSETYDQRGTLQGYMELTAFEK